MKKDLHYFRLLFAKSYFATIVFFIAISTLVEVLTSVYLFHTPIRIMPGIGTAVVLGIFIKKYLAIKYHDELKKLEE